MLAETEHKGGMNMYAHIILADDDNERHNEDNEYYADTEECESAVQYCKKSAEMGSTDAMALFAECLLYGHFNYSILNVITLWALSLVQTHSIRRN